MKKAAIIFSAFLMAISCSNGGYVIKGDIRDLDEGTINLLDAYGHTLATTQVKDGKFTFKGKTEVPQLTYINNALGVKYPLDLPILLENKRIKVKGNAAQGLIEITGTAANENMVTFKKKRDALSPNDREGFTALVRETFEANSDNLLGAMMITNMYTYVSDEELVECYRRLPAELSGNKLISHYHDISLARMETAPGKKFKELCMEDKQGVPRKLSDAVAGNDFTLLLFWASWTYGNKSVLPDFGALCRRHSDKGLALYSISLDSNEDKWREALGKYGLEGTNLQGDYNQAKACADIYGIDGMPRALLIGRDGTIIARSDKASDFEPFL
ncbi:MAG: AhpC/TSA family protein [Bacteroidales bacterium]|nr:AhpC/TSA family protein [Candidatus Cacconaster scatequi]